MRDACRVGRRLAPDGAIVRKSEAVSEVNSEGGWCLAANPGVEVWWAVVRGMRACLWQLVTVSSMWAGGFPQSSSEPSRGPSKAELDSPNHGIPSCKYPRNGAGGGGGGGASIFSCFLFRKVSMVVHGH